MQLFDTLDVQLPHLPSSSPARPHAASGALCLVYYIRDVLLYTNVLYYEAIDGYRTCRSYGEHRATDTVYSRRLASAAGYVLQTTVKAGFQVQLLQYSPVAHSA
jgi:hypothetical protein